MTSMTLPEEQNYHRHYRIMLVVFFLLMCNIAIMEGGTSMLFASVVVVDEEEQEPMSRLQNIATRVTIKAGGRHPRRGGEEEVQQQAIFTNQEQHGAHIDTTAMSIDVIQVVDIIVPKKPSEDVKSMPHHVVYTSYIRPTEIQKEEMKSGDRSMFGW